MEDSYGGVHNIRLRSLDGRQGGCSVRGVDVGTRTGARFLRLSGGYGEGKGYVTSGWRQGRRHHSWTHDGNEKCTRKTWSLPF